MRFEAGRKIPGRSILYPIGIVFMASANKHNADLMEYRTGNHHGEEAKRK